MWPLVSYEWSDLSQDEWHALSRHPEHALDGVCQTVNATVSWNAVTRNADGTAITDLAGYNVYIGLTPGVYTSHVTVPSTQLSVVYNGLNGAVSHYWVVTAFDTAIPPNESGRSMEINKAPLAQLLPARMG